MNHRAVVSPTMIEVKESRVTPEQLAAQSKAGCRDSFDQLVELFLPRIYNYLAQMTGDPSDAEDLVQETFLKSYKGLDRYDVSRPFAPWLFAIARRTVFSHWRQRKTRVELSTTTDHSEETPLSILESKEQTDSLWTLARRLPKNYFEVLWLRYAEELSILEIARVQGRTTLHVKVLLHRARTRVARLRSEHVPGSTTSNHA